MTNIERLLKEFGAEATDAFFISNESNLTYLTEFNGDSSYALISLAGSVLMTDGRYDEQARKECSEKIEVTKWHNPNRPDPATIYYYLEKFKIKRVLFNDKDLSVRDYNSLKNIIDSNDSSIELHAITGVIEGLREVKNELEISYVKKACEISDKALELTVPFIKEGVTELELVARLEYNLKTLGADNISFDTMVLSGDKTSLPHGNPSNKKLERGDFVQFDFGALYKGYHSDMSRTFIILEASDEQVKLYNTMLEATIAGTKALKGNISAKVPDEAVREVLGVEYIKHYYPGLGHGVGLDIHEGPFMSSTSSATIKAGNLVTIEPGVYIPGFGGMRIEDTILVTEDGYEVLSNFPRELMILG